MKATINDVAKLSGVSIKTVSRVMNNEPSVRQLTREKVQAAVKELSYQPNLAARSLAGTKSFTIAYVYDNPNAYYIIDMQEGILSACRQQGFELLINPCDSQKENITEDIINTIKHARVAGLVITPPFSENPEFVKRITEQDIKVVRIISGDIMSVDMTPDELIMYRREVQARWRANNKEKQSMKFRAYYEKNRESHLAKQKVLNAKYYSKVKSSSDL